MYTPGPNDTEARVAGPVHLPSQHAQIDASAHPISHDDTLSEAETLVPDLPSQHAQIDASAHPISHDTLSEAETLVPDDASLRSAKQGEEWRQTGPVAERDAAVRTTSQRHGLRRRTAWNTTRGHRTLRVLARPQSSALAAALYNAEHLHNVRHSALVLGPYGRPPDLAPFGIVLLIIEDIGIARVFSLI
ncbi:hypothetical protein NYO67_4614 [Aspergillus flavus]|nr:hypothetical protein NYO67_4614 [Aspergillus flavus]